MGYDRWMLSPISRGEASQDNERAGGGEGGLEVGEGGEGRLGKLWERELRSHMVGWWDMGVWQVLKKAPE